MHGEGRLRETASRQAYQQRSLILSDNTPAEVKVDPLSHVRLKCPLV